MRRERWKADRQGKVETDSYQLRVLQECPREEAAHGVRQYGGSEDSELGSGNKEGSVGPLEIAEGWQRASLTALRIRLREKPAPPSLKCSPLQRARTTSPPSPSHKRGSPGHFGGSLCKQKKLFWKLNVVSVSQEHQ